MGIKDVDGDDGENEVVLGTPSGSDNDQSEQESEQSDEESVEEIPLKKRQKTSDKQTGKGSLNNEEKALKLLDKSFF